MSVYYVGGAYNSCLVEIEKADLARLEAEHPDGWSGKYSTWKKE
jgi:hypothetical protein